MTRSINADARRSGSWQQVSHLRERREQCGELLQLSLDVHRDVGCAADFRWFPIPRRISRFSANSSPVASMPILAAFVHFAVETVLVDINASLGAPEESPEATSDLEGNSEASFLLLPGARVVKPSNSQNQQANPRAALRAQLAGPPREHQSHVADLEARMLLLSEDLVSLGEVAQELDIHISGPYRWRHRGVRGVRLETIRIGGKLLTSRQAVTRFLRATQG